MNITYTGPDGQQSTQPEMSDLRDAILHPGGEYWLVGNGNATLSYTDGDRTIMLLVLPNADHGVYLKHLTKENRRIVDTWLSLGDRTKLDEVVECSEEWFASVGLFLQPEVAWQAVDEFLSTGQRSGQVEWITPDDIPADGNW